jgi:hypothetical protein
MSEHDELIEGDFPAAENTPGQAESRAARSQLDRWLKEQGDQQPAWLDLWNDLRAEQAPMVGRDGELLLNERGEARTRRRWDWRKALYIAWASVPRSRRHPATLDGLCDLLGLSSAGSIRGWRRNDPEIVERIASLPATLLMDHVADVLDALTTVAKWNDPRAHPDRKLFLEITRIYHPKGIVEVEGRLGLDVDDPLEDEEQAAVEELLRARARVRSESGDGGSGGATAGGTA